MYICTCFQFDFVRFPCGVVFELSSTSMELFVGNWSPVELPIARFFACKVSNYFPKVLIGFEQGST